MPDDEGDDCLELTPEQRERLRQQIGRIYKGLALGWEFKLPKIDIGTSAFPIVAADAAKLSRLALPEGLLKGFVATSIFAEQNARLLDQIKPFLDAQSAWQRTLPVITSDMFKWTGVTQVQLNAITSQLIKGADFGWTDQLGQFAKLYSDQQTDWLKAIAPSLSRLKGTFFPSNLQGVKDLSLEEVEQVVMLDGIGLYEVPRTEIAERLIRASSNSARREVLGQKWREIVADCRTALESCHSPKTAPMARFATDAIDAVRAGNVASAQALVGSLLDTVLRRYLPTAKPLIVPGKNVKNADAYLDFSVRKYIALAPIWQAYQSYYPEIGDRVPRTFNRHATAHTVGSQQYSRRNAVQGLLLVCGLLKFLDE